MLDLVLLALKWVELNLLSDLCSYNQALHFMKFFNLLPA